MVGTQGRASAAHRPACSALGFEETGTASGYNTCDGNGDVPRPWPSSASQLRVWVFTPPHVIHVRLPDWRVALAANASGYRAASEVLRMLFVVEESMPDVQLFDLKQNFSSVT